MNRSSCGVVILLQINNSFGNVPSLVAFLLISSLVTLCPGLWGGPTWHQDFLLILKFRQGTHIDATFVLSAKITR